MQSSSVKVKRGPFLAGTCCTTFLLYKFVGDWRANWRNVKKNLDWHSFWLRQWGSYLFNFWFSYCSNFLKNRGANWFNLKKRDWDISFFNRIVVSIWHFRTNSWITADAVFLKLSITSPIMVSNIFEILISTDNSECFAESHLTLHTTFLLTLRICISSTQKFKKIT